MQVTVSPACSEIAFTGDWSSQVADSSSQPSGTTSATVYVPGSRSPELFCPLSASENPSAS